MGLTSARAIARAGETLQLLDATTSPHAAPPERTNRHLYTDASPLDLVPFAEKVGLLEKIDAIARARDPRVAQVSAMSSQSVSVWSGRVEDLHPEGDHSRTVVVFDPPYHGATGYALDLVRPGVVDVALRWAARGATVLVCEAEPIAGLEAEGWHVYDVSAFGRTGGKPEWVTLSRQATRRARARLTQRNSEQLQLPGLQAHTGSEGAA